MRSKTEAYCIHVLLYMTSCLVAYSFPYYLRAFACTRACVFYCFVLLLYSGFQPGLQKRKCFIDPSETSDARVGDFSLKIKTSFRSQKQVIFHHAYSINTSHSQPSVSTMFWARKVKELVTKWRQVRCLV